MRLPYFEWRLGKRTNEVYQADGRSNPVNLGRHSLGTKDKEEAYKRLEQLDRQIASQRGLVAPAPVNIEVAPLPLDEGVKRYMEYVGRPAVAGGAGASTHKRYRPVFDKFSKVMRANGIDTWTLVTRDALNIYLNWLEDNDYMYSGEYLELTTIKQCLKWLIDSRLVPESCRFAYPLTKPSDDSDTYCYTLNEVSAMITLCVITAGMQWLGWVIAALAYSGLRVSELAALRWSDIDEVKGVLRVPDRSRRGTRSQRDRARKNKGRRSREIPIHPKLRKVLSEIPRHSDGRVFHGPLGGVLKPGTVRNILIRDVIDPLAPQFPSAPDERGFVDGRVHSLRHYFCSACANAGVPERMLMDWLGHRDAAMVRRYYHGNAEQSKSQMSGIVFVNEKWGQSVGTLNTSERSSSGSNPMTAQT